ncbi:hypothetical protein BGZ99_003177 [Dissophora globulifera]|uniref:Uncharacterized protein n=1 Tax=Dissophora globulifera TaxID=979702 RepID=A0A9P6UVH6_9FUNG|nr:hypothetical protein BGZ99_003177 [Dissophora globulifera]
MITATATILPTQQASFSFERTIITFTMAIFKLSNKVKPSASASSTPEQTPRSSINNARRAPVKKLMTPEEALYKISQNMMINAAAGPFIM